MTDTISLKDVYPGAEHYVGEDDAAAIEGLPATAWPALQAACRELTGGASEPGIDCCVAKTRETLHDFDEARSRHWSERGARADFTFDGHAAVMYERVQIAKGTPRFSQIVVDFGSCRAVLSTG